MPIEIRTAREDEMAGFIDAMSTAFLDRPEVDKVAAEVIPMWDRSRAWIALDGARVVGTFRTWATELTVPGNAQIPASAVTNVTVLPTHRRRGILRSMAQAEHAAARERGELASLLYAAEYPIYGRFGYGPACRLATITLDTLGTTFSSPATGSMELVTPSAAARDAIRAVYEAWRVTRVGEIRRREFRWDFDLGLREQAWGPRWKGFLALHRNDGGDVDGYVRYRAEEKWEQGQPRGVLTIDDLHAVDDAAYHALWRFLADVDLVSKVKAEFRRVDERLPWLLTNARAALVSDSGDGMWARLLDVPGALAARTYERSAALVLDVIDAEAPDGRIRVALDGGPGGASAHPTTKPADLAINVSALSAAYLGGTRLRDAVLATGVDEHTRGALATADALFRTADEPWSSTFF